MLKNKKIFTLVEMLIVVVIIGILAAALIPRLTGAQSRARDSGRKADLNQVSTAISTFISDFGFAPTGTGTNCLGNITGALIPRYIKGVPSDPQSNRITFGTTPNGCTNGVYGYTPLYRNGSMSGGFVIVSRVETDGKVGNFVTFSGATVTFQGTGTASNETVGGAAYLFRNAEHAEPFQSNCEKNGVFIGANNLSANGACAVGDNQGMVYVAIN